MKLFYSFNLFNKIFQLYSVLRFSRIPVSHSNSFIFKKQLNYMGYLRELFSYDKSDLLNVALAPVTYHINIFKIVKSSLISSGYSDKQLQEFRKSTDFRRTERRLVGSGIGFTAYVAVAALTSPEALRILAYDIIPALPALILPYVDQFAGQRISNFMNTKIINPVARRLRNQQDTKSLLLENVSI